MKEELISNFTRTIIIMQRDFANICFLVLVNTFIFFVFKIVIGCFISKKSHPYVGAMASRRNQKKLQHKIRLMCLAIKITFVCLSKYYNGIHDGLPETKKRKILAVVIFLRCFPDYFMGIYCGLKEREKFFD